MASAWDESGQVGSLGGLQQLACRADPMPLGRRVRRLCKAAAGAGSLGGGIPQVGEAWCLQDPASGPCSPAVLPAEPPSGRSGTGFLGGIPLILEEEEEGDSWVGCPAQAACWDAGGR